MAMSPEKLAALKARALANSQTQTTAVVVKQPAATPAKIEEKKDEQPAESSIDSKLGQLVGMADRASGEQQVSVSAVVAGTSLPAVPDSDTVELSPQQFAVVEKIERIRQGLLTQDPMIEILAKQIHQALAKDPELVHLLKPDQIGALVKGLMQVTKTIVVATATKKATTASGKKLSQLTLSDI